MSEVPNRALILVIDDIESNVRLLTHMVKKEGYELMAAFSGEGALSAVKKKKPDLVLLDIMMPGMDGFEVCKRLKTDPEYSDIPILFLSALSDTESKTKAMKIGGADYLTKPFKRQDVLDKIRFHIEGEASVAPG